MTYKCKEKVFNNWHHYPCSRNAWKDGYCKQHHPETVKKRNAEQKKRYKEKREKDPLIKLLKENKRLREALESISKNTCCDSCQEAALVAKEALKR